MTNVSWLYMFLCKLSVELVILVFSLVSLCQVLILVCVERVVLI
jgi:hypothetical protein